jgi:hypothetical protein
MSGCQLLHLKPKHSIDHKHASIKGKVGAVLPRSLDKVNDNLIEQGARFIKY